MTQLNDQQPPTWNDLIARVHAGAGSTARHKVGEWAIQRVREALGDDWPLRWRARHGRLPAFLHDPGSDAVAYAQLVETGLRLSTLADAPRIRRVMKDWSRDLQAIRLLHVRLQLEIAALARVVCGAVEFEKPIELPQGQRPADVVIAAGPSYVIVECFCVYTDQTTSAELSYDHDISLRLQMMALDHDLTISGHWDVRLSPQETLDLVAETVSVMGQVKVDRIARSVTRPGIEFHITSDPQSTTETTRLVGPQTHSAGWRRARDIIRSKAADWDESPWPVWLRVDLLDGTWLFSEWAQRDLPTKTRWMAALLADALDDVGTAGVIVSGGARISPRATAEDYHGVGGIVGMRRRVDALRIRDTIIVPLTPDGAQHAAIWRDAYNAEPRWLENALTSVSLPSMSAVESGWSAPADERPTG